MFILCTLSTVIEGFLVTPKKKTTNNVVHGNPFETNEKEREKNAGIVRTVQEHQCSWQAQQEHCCQMNPPWISSDVSAVVLLCEFKKTRMTPDVEKWWYDAAFFWKKKREMREKGWGKEVKKGVENAAVNHGKWVKVMGGLEANLWESVRGDIINRRHESRGTEMLNLDCPEQCELIQLWSVDYIVTKNCEKVFSKWGDEVSKI